ncbi:hypothetical protein NPIL_661151 [Nephila pilipes]|uniref:Uncharacterized protein n=1 Tax=Nephila pilipes TaxID=299642 RepID=A0A8X6TQ13_NEPPI|nr:hypothetical protein NPIL_661151 [Nephila pilipes]
MLYGVKRNRWKLFSARLLSRSYKRDEKLVVKYFLADARIRHLFRGNHDLLFVSQCVPPTDGGSLKPCWLHGCGPFKRKPDKFCFRVKESFCLRWKKKK